MWELGPEDKRQEQSCSLIDGKPAQNHRGTKGLTYLKSRRIISLWGSFPYPTLQDTEVYCRPSLSLVLLKTGEDQTLCLCHSCRAPWGAWPPGSPGGSRHCLPTPGQRPTGDLKTSSPQHRLVSCLPPQLLHWPAAASSPALLPFWVSNPSPTASSAGLVFAVVTEPHSLLLSKPSAFHTLPGGRYCPWAFLSRDSGSFLQGLFWCHSLPHSLPHFLPPPPIFLALHCNTYLLLMFESLLRFPRSRSEARLYFPS